MCAYIYLIVEWDRIEENLVPSKIGVTRGSIERRIKKLQTGNNSNLHMFTYFKSEHPFRLEKMLHRHHQKYKTNGEWFNLPNESVLNFKTVCEEKEELIKFLLRENYFYK
jgi:hypothetical protein